MKANFLAQRLFGKYGFTYINGIEIDCTYKKSNISIIGYGIDIKSKDFDEIDAKTDDIENVLLSKQEYKNHSILQKYRLMAENKIDMYDALNHDFYSEGGLCYVKINYMDVEEAISIIHKNGGKAVFTLSEFAYLDHADIIEFFDLRIDFIDYFGNYIVKHEKDVLFKKSCNRVVLNKL